MELTFTEGTIKARNRSGYVISSYPGHICKELPFGIFNHDLAVKDVPSSRMLGWNVTHTRSGWSAGVFKTLDEAKQFVSDLATLDVDWDFGFAGATEFFGKHGKEKLHGFLKKATPTAVPPKAIRHF